MRFPRSLRPAQVILCIALWLAGAAVAASAKAPSNVHLIAAMPSGVESVLVFRYAELTSDTSALKDDVYRTIDNLGKAHSEDERNQLLNIVLRYVAMSNPIVHAQGGSAFTRVTGDPRGLGLGNYHGRSIWYVERSLEPLRRRLDESRDIVGPVQAFKLDGVPIYQTEVTQHALKDDAVTPIQEQRFIAFPSDRCVVIVEDRGELEHILKVLRSDGRELPAGWRKVAGDLDVESPIILLRCYDPTNELDYYSPVNPRKSGFDHVDIESVALALPSVERLTFRMHCVSKEPQKAVTYYGHQALRREVFDWKVTWREGGFAADLTVIDEQRGRSYPTLVLYLLFGANLFL